MRRLLVVLTVLLGIVGGAVALRRTRRGEVALLAGRIGRRAALNRARAIFADAAGREALDAELQLHTAEEVARTLGQMKGALMKVGQLASFVHDGMPEPVREALEQLQHSAPPMAPELAAEMIERELGAPPDRLFETWDETPIAAASIGQVHRAMTSDGRAVAVKVQYPDVADAIARDLANLDIATLVMPMMWKSLDAKAVADELKERLSEELDYTIEASNQRSFAEWYRDHPFIHVPDVLPELSSQRVLTTELAAGVRFQEMETWSQEQKDLAGECIYRFVFRSLYRHGAFNGDPNPGNYLFEGDGRVTFLDFGLVKHYTDADLALALDIADAAVLDPSPDKLRRATERAGYFKPGNPLTDEQIASYGLAFWEPLLERGQRTITAEWATELVQKYMGFGRVDSSHEAASIIDYAQVPKDFVILQRINLGLFAILGRLGATSDWRGISEEIWPTVDGPPATALGELEAEWRRSRSATVRAG
jgi:predicted unusual protein kinase regulating ubiquinone biosynthesis (AarF/ABC1/UbiB family)